MAACEVNKTHKHTNCRDKHGKRCNAHHMKSLLVKVRKTLNDAGLSLAILVGLLIFRRYAVRSR